MQNVCIVHVQYLLLFLTLRIHWWSHGDEVFILVDERSGDCWLVHFVNISEPLVDLNVQLVSSGGEAPPSLVVQVAYSKLLTSVL